MTVNPALAEAGAAPQPPNPHPPKNLQEAATQFEALMISQMLKSAHDDDGGWLGSGGESGNSMAAELAEQQFAQALAKSGGLGLSARIVSSLAPAAKAVVKETPPAPPSARLNNTKAR